MRLRSNKTLEQTYQRPKKRRRTDSTTSESESEDSQMPGAEERPGDAAVNEEATSVNMETAPATAKGSEERTSRFAIRKIIFKPKEAVSAQTITTTMPPPPIILPHKGGKNINNSPPVNTSDHLTKETPTPVLLKAALSKKINRGDYLIRNLNNATQIRATNMQAHNDIRELLSTNNIQHYTYSNDRPKFKKFVLYGLNTEDIGDIKSDLCEYGLSPVDIKQMTIRKPRYHDHSNYIIYFDQEEKVTLPKLQQAKYICNTLVTWDYYKNKSDQCLQCQNCLRYNHGARECSMKVVCFLCAENHNAEECTLMQQKIETKADKIPSDCLKCVNCGGKHTAVYKMCPSRIHHINNKSSSRPAETDQRHPAQQTVTFAPADPPKQNYWETNTKQRAVTKKQQSPMQQRRPNGTTPSSTGDTRTPRSSRTPKYRQNQTIDDHRTSHKKDNSHHSWANSINSIKNNQYENRPTPSKSNFNYINNTFSSTSEYNNDTFAPHELAEIFQEMLGSIRQCRNKEDQLNALMNLAIKYMPCRG